ncbi:flagellar hook-basal body complex protein FliE [Roseovarius sp.]|jgi:flagellar hook-basal body complex protein FliE
MSISSISTGLNPAAITSTQAPAKIETTPQTGADRPSFGERLGDAINKVADQQKTASAAARDFETGKTENIAAVMVEQQVSSLGFQMTLSVRNKALSAYRDIMNMPV